MSPDDHEQTNPEGVQNHIREISNHPGSYSRKTEMRWSLYQRKFFPGATIQVPTGVVDDTNVRIPCSCSYTGKAIVNGAVTEPEMSVNKGASLWSAPEISDDSRRSSSHYYSEEESQEEEIKAVSEIAYPRYLTRMNSIDVDTQEIEMTSLRSPCSSSQISREFNPGALSLSPNSSPRRTNEIRQNGSLRRETFRNNRRLARGDFISGDSIESSFRFSMSRQETVETDLKPDYESFCAAVAFGGRNSGVLRMEAEEAPCRKERVNGKEISGNNGAPGKNQCRVL
ncbi:hypothetical protein RUM44_005623 [Polyplax serrata]|uniref:Uncharacterized protein n=1 Tax=Polyplax serrata TaxID=468196 RepID=A0ABR1ADW3_POLSC